MEGGKSKPMIITNQCNNATNTAAEHSMFSMLFAVTWEIMDPWTMCESGEAHQSFGLGGCLQKHKGWVGQGKAYKGQPLL